MNIPLRMILVSQVALASMFVTSRPDAQQIRELPADDLSCLYSTGSIPAKTLFTFEAGPRAEAIVSEIVGVYGLQPNFILRSGDVQNICAMRDENNQRYIIYSALWLDSLSSKLGNNKWPIYVAFAHEIGHHYNNDTFQGGGNTRIEELSADQFAGKAVRLLGASLEDALTMINIIASDSVVPPPGTRVHPYPRIAARRAAIRAAWNGDVVPPPPPPPEPEDIIPTTPLVPAPVYVPPPPPVAGEVRENVFASLEPSAPAPAAIYVPPPALPEPPTATTPVPSVSEPELPYSSLEDSSKLVGLGSPQLQNRETCGLKVIPPTFKTVNQTVVVERPSESLEVVPPTFRNVSRRVLIEEEHWSEDTLATTTQRYVVTEASERLQVVPATYRTISETVVVQPAHESLLIVPDTGRVRRIAIPAQTRTIQRREIATPASVRRVTVPPITDTYSVRRVERSTSRGTLVPAKYGSVQLRVIETPSSVRRVSVPGKTATIQTRIIDQPATTRDTCS